MYPDPSLCSEYTVKETAKKLECEDKHVIALYEAGELDGVDISLPGSKRRMLRFSDEDLENFRIRRKGRGRPVTKVPPTVNAKGISSAGPIEDYSSWFED